MIQGLIFDKDGTLFDFHATWGVWTRTLLVTEARGDLAILNSLADALGYDLAGHQFQPDSIVIAEPVDRVARAIMAVTQETDIAALTIRLNAATSAVPQQPAADLPLLMTQLRAMRLTLGVVTNDAEAPALRHLKDAGILHDMLFVAGYDSGHGAKPDAAPLLAFARQAGLEPAQCAMIGDSTHDLRAGRAAGMVCIGVLTGPTPHAALAPFADVILGSIADLPAWLAARV